MSNDERTETEMPCQACNAEARGVRTLAVARRGGGTQHLQMWLCEQCFEELTAESWIEAPSVAAE